MLTRVKESLRRTWVGLVVGGSLAIGAVGVLYHRASEQISLPPVLRISSESGVSKLEVPIVRYSKGEGFPSSVAVDFIGAVHLGEADYYRALNKRFEDYDAVLFELVSDGDSIPVLGEKRPDSLLGTVQRAMSNLLGLSFQLDEINYQARNFVHADLSPERLRQAMDARGESLPQLLMKLIRISTDPEVERALKAKGFNENALDGINPLLILFRGPTKEERVKLRRFVAQGLIGSDAVMKILEGDNGFSLITDRNQEVVKVLTREMDAGKKRIGVFYGVGHLPDMHERLVQQGFHISDVEWLVAWSM